MGNDKPASAPPADRERVIVEMRHAAELLGDTQVADDLLEWADQIEALATSAQGREVEANCRGSWQLGNNCKRCPRCLSTMSAAEPAPVAQDWHVRHLGAGLLAQYHGDEYVRDIGGTVGWDFKDRDEFIVRYNDHADHARIVALGDMQYQKLLAKYEATEASLAACRADAERLDWLEASGWPGQFERTLGRPDHQRWFDANTVGSDYSPTLRAAIDAARSKP